MRGLLVVLSLTIGAPGCGGEVKVFDCNAPDKCTGIAPGPDSLFVQLCEARTSEPVCGVIWQRYMECISERATCPYSVDGGSLAAEQCVNVSLDLGKCNLARSKRYSLNDAAL